MTNLRWLALTIVATSGCAPTPGSGGGEGATYTLQITNEWDEERHPVGYPEDPHFAWMTGATHVPEARFWSEGHLASVGMANLVTGGSPDQFLNVELGNAQVRGEVGDVLFEPFLTPAIGNSTQSTFLVAAPHHPAITLALMVGPSPDWFVGVDGLLLTDEFGQWLDEIDVDLPLLDGGCESGREPVMDNPATHPAEPIHRIGYDSERDRYVSGVYEHVVGRLQLTRVD